MPKILFNRLMTITAFCISVLLLQGCGNKVDCNSEKTKTDAIAIIQSNLAPMPWYQQIGGALSGSAELTNIKTTSRNDDIKQATCSATYSFTYNGKPREFEVTYYLAYLADKSETEVKVGLDRIVGSFVGMVNAEPPIKNGEEKIIDPKTGNLQHTIEWKNNVQDGTEKIYNPSTNKLIGEIHVANGQKVGSEKRWNTDGTVLLIDLYWVDGKATGFQKQYNASGDKLTTDLTFKDGKATGFQTVSTRSSEYEEFSFKDGQYDGAHKVYAMDGVTGKMFLRKTENYKAGKLDGPVQLFDESGNEETDMRETYQDGVKVAKTTQTQDSTAGQGVSPQQAPTTHKGDLGDVPAAK